MKYRELVTQTKRKPSNKNIEDGFDLLLRAGYLFDYPDDILPPLGEKIFRNLDELKTTTKTAEDFFAKLSVPFFRSEQNEYFSANSKNGKKLLQCPSCKYTATYEVAKFRKNIFSTEEPKPIEKVNTPDSSTIESLANYLKIPKERTAKAIMVKRIFDQKFVLVVIRGDMFLSEAKLKNLIGEFKPATYDEIILAGAAPGYASPIGLQDTLVIVDDLISKSPNLVAGANESGFHFVNVNYGRDYTANIVEDIVQAKQGFPCPNGDGILELYKGLLLAQINGKRTDFHLYEILLALAETYHDEQGLTLPHPVTPFDVYLMHIPGKQMDTRASAEKIYNELQNANIAVLFDDRDERAGVKFNDADLIGCPLRVTVGEKGLKEGMVELKPRKAKENERVPIDHLVETIHSTLK